MTIQFTRAKASGFLAVLALFCVLSVVFPPGSRAQPADSFALDAEFSVDTSTLRGAPDLATLSNGRVALVWFSDQQKIAARIFNGRGKAVTRQFSLTGNTKPYITSLNVAPLPGARFVVARHLSDNSLVAEIFRANGQRQGRAIAIARDVPFGASIAPLGRGFVAVWTDRNYDIVGQRFNTNGVKVGRAFLVNRTRNHSQTPDVAALNAQRYAVTWMHDYDIAWQVLKGSGTKSGPEYRLRQANAQYAPRVARINAGQFAIVWLDDKSDKLVGQVRTTGGKLVRRFAVANGVRAAGYEIASFPNGRFAVSWRDGSAKARTAIFSASGARVGKVVDMGSATSDPSNRTAVSVFNNRKFVVAYQHSGEILGKIYSP